MPWLKVFQGDTPGKTLLLDQEFTVLGRDPSCEIVLDDPEVSKRHARITRGDDGFSIEDLQSTNGTRVGDRDLTAVRRLEPGDRIEIGSTVLVFEADPTILSSVDTSSQTDAQIVRVRSEEKLQAVLEIARALDGTLELGGVLDQVLETLFRILPQAERGFILLEQESPGDLILKASRFRDHAGVSPVFSRTIFDHVINEGRALLCEDVRADPRFDHSPSVKESQLRTMMCVPLGDRQRRRHGVIQMDTRDEHGRFEPVDLDLLVAVAGPVSVAIENARLHEIAVEHAKWEREARNARAVQLALIPGRKPPVPGYEFWDFYEPALHVGGDYFDYRPVAPWEHPPDRPSIRWAITLGDVMGKGMPAALLMARLSSEVGLLLQIEPDPTRVVERLNRNLCQAGMAEMFITFVLVLLDGDRHELTVVNAGHMGPMIRRADGRIEVIGEEESGSMLGLDEDSLYGATHTSIGSGDVVILYTDGVSEAMDPQRHQFGFERLREALVQAPTGAPAIGEAILSAVRRHTAGCDPSDDITLLCWERAVR